MSVELARLRLGFLAAFACSILQIPLLAFAQGAPAGDQQATQVVAPSATPAPPAAPPNVRVPPNPALPSLFIVGDSSSAKSLGWGVPLANYFDPATVNFLNRAVGGKSSRTFITEGYWERVQAELKKGDVILIQFGCNDFGPINDAARARGSMASLGEETEEIENEYTKKHEVVHTFGWYMRQMIAGARAMGARPVIISTTLRNIWREGRIERGLGIYSQLAGQLAAQEKVPFIDLTNLIADAYEQVGRERVATMYMADRVHFDPKSDGADFCARIILPELVRVPGMHVTRWLSEQGRSATAASNKNAKPTTALIDRSAPLVENSHAP